MRTLRRCAKLATYFQLQGAVRGGRRDRRERDRAAEYAARQNLRRLHRHRRMVEEVDQGGAEVLQRQRRRVGQGQRLHAHSAARRLEARCQRRLCAHHRQRDHRRRRVPLHARRRWRAAGGRHVVQHPVAAARRVEVRPDLRRRAEESRPLGRHHRHRARRPDRQGVAGVPDGVRLQARGRQRLDANTPPTHATYIGLVLKWIEVGAPAR